MSAVHRTGAPAGLMWVAAQRTAAPSAVTEAAKRLALESFDRGVARHLEPTDHAVVAESRFALYSFRRARALGVTTVLDYPIAHHRFAERLLQEEARLQPAYASTLQFHSPSTSVRRRLEQELELADRVLVLSSFQRRTFLECGVDPAKLEQTPLGVELDAFTPAEGAVSEHVGLRVLFAGQLTQRKGISYLIEGFRSAALPDSSLTLLGGLVGGRVPWGPHPGIRHAPPVPFFDLPAYYHGADVFVLPSLIEGFPQTALQAMASGLPVIVSENTFGTDVVTDGVDGYVVPIRDPGAIAERLRHLSAHPDQRRRMGANARRRAQDFSWGRYGERVVNVIRGLL